MQYSKISAKDTSFKVKGFLNSFSTDHNIAIAETRVTISTTYISSTSSKLITGTLSAVFKPPKILPTEYYAPIPDGARHGPSFRSPARMWI